MKRARRADKTAVRVALPPSFVREVEQFIEESGLQMGVDAAIQHLASEDRLRVYLEDMMKKQDDTPT